MPSVDGHQPSPLVSVSPDRFMSNCPTLPFNNKAMSHRSPLHSSDSLAPSLSSWSSSETESQTRCRSFTYPQGTFLPPATGLTLESSDHDPSPQVNAFLANPTVHRTHDNKGYQCPLCPQVFRDSYSTMSSNSSQHSHFSESASSPRRQVRTEALKEHLGVKHNLLPKHPCPFRNHTRCKSSPHGFVKCHRLANHIFDNALCRASAVAALDSASDDDASVVAADQGLIESIRWALGPNARTCTVAELADLFKARLVKRLDAASAASTLTTASASADKSGGKRRAKQARVVDMDDVENHAPRPATTSSSESSASEASNKRRRTLATTSEVEFTRFWNQLHSDLPSSSLPTSANDNVITFTLSPPTSPTSTLDWFSDMISNSTSTDTVSTCPFPSSLASTSPCPFQSLQIPTPQPSPSPLVLPTILPNSQPALMDPLMLTTAAAFDMPPAHALAPPPPVPTSAVASTLASTLDCGLFYPPVTQVAQISPFALPPALPVPRQKGWSGV
ncbi:hypothetical protein BCR44DRAFT_1276440 [Catenaria anguillulae PL171]|uniref:Uncharacterized protein n=1 Tax=Catenaria anguillulae PL171 TaxID=765915 RepID=A0A1Y2H9I7_9FUNG|nr:hypothetical protein BCR44DRAFT_1276440 [Catenaria anguillulae PL171]